LIANLYASRQIRLSSVAELLDHMEEYVRNARKKLYLIRDKPYDEWDIEEKDAADKVARAFDILGVLDSTRSIDRRFVDRFNAIPAVEIWEICALYVRAERKKKGHGEHHFWEFEQLANRVKYVKKNHPAYNNKKRWPPFPRRKRPYLFW
jgi:hypothetical protein